MSLLRPAPGVLGAGLLSLMAIAPGLAQTSETKPPTGTAVVMAEPYQIPRQEWTYGGLFGYFDEQQLRRGYKVYKEVCSNCHNMGFLSYRNLGEAGRSQFPGGSGKGSRGGGSGS